MIYKQSTGELFAEGKRLGQGYAGNGAGLNNPEMQQAANVGPLPRGRYRVGRPYDNPKTGKFTLDLEPDPANEMFGRSAFRMHGDNEKFNQSASEGCIVMPLLTRWAVAGRLDEILDVIQ